LVTTCHIVISLGLARQRQDTSQQLHVSAKNEKGVPLFEVSKATKKVRKDNKNIQKGLE